MAVVYNATLAPGKPQFLEAWLDRQSWGGSGEIEILGSYRFDDPEGRVGVESFVVRRAGTVLHIPVTYRDAPLEAADAELVDTVDHSVLGKRWIYDATTDPVGLACFTRALAGEQQQATMEIYENGEFLGVREPAVRVRREAGYAGDPDAAGELRFARVLDGSLDGAERLVASWADGEAVVAAR